MNSKKLYALVLLLTGFSGVYAQQQETTGDKGQFSGNFQTNNQFYLRDEKIGANTTQYLHEKSSTEAWLLLNYKIRGFNFTMRYDMYNNSPLFNPQQAYSNQGLGFWQVSKDVEKLNFTVGYFYDQFGTGMVFRAYEDRNLGIDCAIQGARVTYNMSEKTHFKAFTGKQKYRFDVREPIIKGVNAEHQIDISENMNTEIGASVVNRTLDATTFNAITTLVNNSPIENRFYPTQNVYAWNIYNTLNYKNFTLYLEYCNKTSEAIIDASNNLINRNGHIYYTSLSYSAKGIGINAQYKRIERFPLRVNPLEIQPAPNNAVINYLPSLTRQNTYRLLARYNAVVQELGENAAQVEVTLKPSKSTQVNLNASAVTRLNGLGFKNGTPDLTVDTTTRLFEEFYVDVAHKFSKSFKAMAGIQFIGYNQVVFEAKPREKAPYVNAITPFGEFTYRFQNTRSLRLEWQYMHTKQDLGKFINALLEYNIAPHWSFAAGDLINIEHGTVNVPDPGKKFEYVHYFNLFASYTYKTTRLTAGFLKQPQGVNCTGGVCRVEPAFSGGRITLTTNF